MNPRVIYNDDGANVLYCWDDLTAADLRDYLERLRGTHVDMVAYCVTFGGYVTYYPSDIAELLGTGYCPGTDIKTARAAANLRRLEEEGGYLNLVFSQLKEMGIAALASFRMNDAHMSSDPTGPCAGRMWMAHPEWRLGEPYRYYAACLDYAVPAVREYLLRLVQEVIARYPDIDGVELDGLRSPFFFKEGQGEANAPLMTDLMRQVRAALDNAATQRGRERYLLRVNVPGTPELALECGMDVAAWEREGLVDGISPGTYQSDFQPAVAAWKQALANTPVHPYLNCSPATGQYLSLEEYRGATANAWNAGADGVYLFNFPCHDELCFQIPVPVDRRPFPAPEFQPPVLHAQLTRGRLALGEVGDPQQMAHRDKRFLFAMEKAHYRHELQEVQSLGRLPAGSRSMELVWHCHEDFAAASAITLECKLVGVARCEEFEFTINGQAVRQMERLHASNGRDVRLNVPRPLPPYSVYTLTLDPEVLRPGANTLGVTLTRSDPNLLGAIDLMEVALTVKYP
jgi:hypothetical protein